ncbi:hypothetical protein [Pararhizobium sp. DWP3-4]|uniref:hypothetical protein n=1 Tax=Pararhizobium sp. DWP3-4 TaxID=2804565 RepID=UPI003CFA63C0
MPVQVTIHRINGEAATMTGLDARQAVQNHPKEWSYEPFPPEARKAALNDPLFVPYNKPEAYTSGHSAMQHPFTVAAES